MGVFYLVEPLDDEQRQWLAAEDVALPRGNQRGRNPTPAQIREVCSSLSGFAVDYRSSEKHKFWQANIQGLKGADRKRATLLNIDHWGGSENKRYKIVFEKGDPLLILQIVHGLTAHCGPLVVVPDSGEVPVVLWADADPKKLSRAWGDT